MGDDGPLSDRDEARRVGAAAGAGGAAGAFAWLNRKNMEGAIDGVSPATGRGFLLAVLWCIGFGVVFAVGRVVAPSWGSAWGAIAIAVMVVVAMVWRRVFPRSVD